MSQNKTTGNGPTVANLGPDHPLTGAPIIYAYTRAQAIADGVLIDVSATAREAGFAFPVAITAGVFATVVNPSERAAKAGESISGRLWDVLQMMLWAARALPDASDRVTFQVIATGEDGNKRRHDLWASVGPGDDAAPVITVMLRGED